MNEHDDSRTAAAVPAHLEQKPMSYKEFLEAGNKDSDWDAYREQQNNLSRDRGANKVVSNWHSGSEQNGNDVANALRHKGVTFSDDVGRLLQHDDTKVSKTSVTGRGVPRKEAAKLHRWLYEQMLDC